MKIAEMKVGERITGVRLVITAATVRPARNGKNYLDVTISDGAEEFNGKLWSFGGKTPVVGIYEVTGDIGEYNGKKQITLTEFKISDSQDMTDFTKSYAEHPEIWWASAQERISQIQDEALSNVVKYVYDLYKDKILLATSAKGVHHVGILGNLCHTIEVYDYAVTMAMVAQTYSTPLCPINFDLVRAGALLHDIGKPLVYSQNGAIIEYSFIGNMLDHIVVGIDILNRADDHFENKYYEQILLLKHIIASHHGVLEHGSPVVPRFIEAIIVNKADGASASINTVVMANIKAMNESKSMTEKIWTQNNAEHFLQTRISDILEERLV